MQDLCSPDPVPDGGSKHRMPNARSDRCLLIRFFRGTTPGVGATRNRISRNPTGRWAPPQNAWWSFDSRTSFGRVPGGIGGWIGTYLSGFSGSQETAVRKPWPPQYQMVLETRIRKDQNRTRRWIPPYQYHSTSCGDPSLDNQEQPPTRPGTCTWPQRWSGCAACRRPLTQTVTLHIILYSLGPGGVKDFFQFFLTRQKKYLVRK